MARLRVLVHLAAACAVLGLALAVGRWLRDPEPGGPLVGIVVLAAVIGVCVHRLYREGGLGRRSPPPAAMLPAPAVLPTQVADPPPPPLWMTTDRVDLNHASLGELQTLPGVGKITAERIAAGRPYGSVGDLSRVGGLGPARIRAIAERARTS